MTLNSQYINLNKKIIACKKCKRLKNFREKIAKEKRKQYMGEKYWGKPITGFGDLNGKIALIGLAPAAHGGNRTGRVFTCLLYTSPSPRDATLSRMPSSA